MTQFPADITSSIYSPGWKSFFNEIGFQPYQFFMASSIGDTGVENYLNSKFKEFEAEFVKVFMFQKTLSVQAIFHCELHYYMFKLKHGDI